MVKNTAVHIRTRSHIALRHTDAPPAYTAESLPPPLSLSTLALLVFRYRAPNNATLPRNGTALVTSAFKSLDMRQLKQMQIRATTRDEVLGSDRELARKCRLGDRGEAR